MCSRAVLQQFKDFGQETGRTAGDRLSKDQMKNQSQSHQPGLRGRPDKDQGKLWHQTPQSRLHSLRHVRESKSIRWIFELKSFLNRSVTNFHASTAYVQLTKLLLLVILFYCIWSYKQTPSACNGSPLFLLTSHPQNNKDQLPDKVYNYNSM